MSMERRLDAIEKRLDQTDPDAPPAANVETLRAYLFDDQPLEECPASPLKEFLVTDAPIIEDIDRGGQNAPQPDA